VLHRLVKQKECQIEEGGLIPNHVHMLISIPPKYSVFHIVGFLKGKSSIWVSQNMIKKYIQNQESDDKKMEQLNLFNK
jgi:putative transposase